MREDSELARLQRWFQAAVLAPEEPGPETERLLTGSDRQTARQRLAVYWRRYRSRLLENMRALHPGLVHLLGRELFHQFALSYLEEHPSRARTLLGLNERFAEHLARTRPKPKDTAGTGGTGDADGGQAWPDLVIDMARYERVRTEVLEGPGAEDAPRLRELPLGPTGPLPDLGLTPAPCLRLLRTTFPVHAYVAAVRRGADPLPPEPRPTFVVVTRHDFEVVTREVTPRAHATLGALVSGATVRAALSGLGREQAVSWLRDWVNSGFFVAVTPPRPAEPDQRATARSPVPVVEGTS
ncbi:HvfC/BufC N-terminal domain-containing protein [Streptoalloteichus hindustanus]|uniref:Putative DNA-binding domain-containing protein n=1 Tax=Streptoalloteichus hindustanus TaxID=2017 RepID=A0A1M4XHJ3_STRHI|nr:DNA-binding domain-containing protein [Streptoalloteichus hindustanus]SHE92979.1 Putative DNA-binding domain-containing protein [Streptoalloteichus hindustanus]